MELKEQLEDLLLLGREVTLAILKVADDELKVAKEVEDFEKVKSIASEVIPQYERMYNEFLNEISEEIDEEVVEKTEEIVYKLLEEHNLDEEVLWESVRKRLELKGDSGAEVVEKLYKYQIRELKDEKNKLLEVERKLLEKQKEYEMELADCVQEEEELKAFEKVRDNSNKLDRLDEKLNFIEIKLADLEYSVRTKWRCDLFGTTSKEELLKVYKEVE